MRPAQTLFPTLDGARTDLEPGREVRDGVAQRVPQALNLFASHDTTV